MNSSLGITYDRDKLILCIFLKLEVVFEKDESYVPKIWLRQPEKQVSFPGDLCFGRICPYLADIDPDQLTLDMFIRN